MRKLLFLGLIAVMVFVQVSPGVGAYTDISTNWARQAIMDLESRDVLTGFFDDEFGPHQPMEYSTFVELARRAFDIDVEMELPEESEDQLVTRSQLLSLTANLMGISERTITLSNWYPTFEDLDQDNPIYLEAEVLNMLGMLPTYIFDRLEPTRPATRAEVAHLLSKASSLEPLVGEISEIADDREQVMVQTETELVAVTLGTSAKVYTDGQVTDVDKLEAGNKIFALVNDESQALLISVPKSGLAALVDTEALMNTLTTATQVLADVLTPEQVTALLNGDWQALSDEVRYELHQRLVDLGVSPWEVDALLAQDWASVQEIAKDRLAAEAADYLNVSPELVFSALNQNWQRLLEYVQVELAQRLLTSSWLKEAN